MYRKRTKAVGLLVCGSGGRNLQSQVGCTAEGIGQKEHREKNSCNNTTMKPTLNGIQQGEGFEKEGFGKPYPLARQGSVVVGSGNSRGEKRSEVLDCVAWHGEGAY